MTLVRLLAAAALTAALAPAAAAAATTDVLTFDAEADTYVDGATGAGAPTSSSLWVDASPPRQSFVRFWVPGIGDREVVAARLRMTQIDTAPTGGRATRVTSAWSETTTWSGRPALGTLVHGRFGAVRAGESHVLALAPSAITSEHVSVGLDSDSADGARWGSSESATPPQLELEVATPAGFADRGLSLVAGAKAASSEPTYHGTNHRVAVTRGGRTLVVHGRHNEGVRLAWRDAGGGWGSATSGASPRGTIAGGTGTGDWPASIAVGTDAAGAEHAWAVWSGPSSTALRAVHLRRISDLDDPAGPSIGPLTTVDAPALGAFRADVAIEAGPDGADRGVVLWSRRTATAASELVTGWFALGDAAPEVEARTVLHRATSSSPSGTLATTPRGVRVAARAGGGALTLFAHDRAAARTTWEREQVGGYVSSRSSPAAATLADGDVLVAVERDVDRDVTDVVRFPAGGGIPVRELSLAGARQPTITADGPRALVLVRDAATGHLVSRERAADGTWTATDRLEVGPEARSPVRFPNALRDARGRVVVLFEGRDGSTTRSAVVAFERPF